MIAHGTIGLGRKSGLESAGPINFDYGQERKSAMDLP